jgi:hypothetical protein
LPEVIDLLLEAVQLPLILLDEGQDRCLGGRWHLAPKFGRDWRRLHSAKLWPLLELGKKQAMNVYFRS